MKVLLLFLIIFFIKSQNHDCGGILYNATGVCNDKGDCIAQGVCNCTDANWFGPLCEVTTCFNEMSNLTSRPAGTCDDFDFCNCTTDWFGPYCNVTTCNGTLSNDTSVCDGNGDCYQPEICNCNNGYARVDSNRCFAICGMYFANNPNVCNGQGNCTSPGICNCTNSNYFGQLCEDTYCNGTMSNSSTVCNTYGSCNTYELCSCRYGYYPPGDNGTTGYCSEWQCNGTHRSDDAGCNNRGVCDSPNHCQCYVEGWGGNLCQYPICKGKYGGNYTSNDYLQRACHGHGTCTNPFTCECLDNWKYTDDCEITDCYGFFSNDTRACNSPNGTCTDYYQCSCVISDFQGYYGDECQEKYYTCGGLKSNDSMVCNGRGACVEKQICRCDTFLGMRAYGGFYCDDNLFFMVVLPISGIIVSLIVLLIVLIILIFVILKYYQTKNYKEPLPNDLREGDDQLLQLLCNADCDNYFENFMRGGVMLKHIIVLYEQKKDKREIWVKLIPKQEDRRRFYKVVKKWSKKAKIERDINIKNIELELLEQSVKEGEIREKKRDERDGLLPKEQEKSEVELKIEEEEEE